MTDKTMERPEKVYQPDKPAGDMQNPPKSPVAQPVQPSSAATAPPQGSPGQHAAGAPGSEKKHEPTKAPGFQQEKGGQQSVTGSHSPSGQSDPSKPQPKAPQA